MHFVGRGNLGERREYLNPHNFQTQRPHAQAMHANFGTIIGLFTYVLVYILTFKTRNVFDLCSLKVVSH